MRLWSSASAAALLFGSAMATSALAAAPYTGCPAGYHRAESEGGGVGSVSKARHFQQHFNLGDERGSGQADRRRARMCRV